MLLLCSCADKSIDVSFDEFKVTYEPVKSTAEPSRSTQAPILPLYIESKPDKYTYDQMVADIDNLKNRYGDTIQVTKLCETFDKRNVYDIVAGNPNGNNHIMISGAMHAREYITAQVVMNQLCDFLELSQSNSAYKGIALNELCKDTALHFIPMVNPDGVTLSQSGPDALLTEQAKSTANNICAANDFYNYEQWKSNAEGTDINRNFDAGWEEYNDSKGMPAPDKYKGTFPGSSAEANALINLTNSYNFRRTISYHTKGSLIYWYYKQTGTVLEESKKFSQSISDLTGYVLDGDYTAVDAAGYKDWAVYKKGIPSITIEVGGEAPDNPVPIEYLDSILIKNKDVVLETLYGLY